MSFIYLPASIDAYLRSAKFSDGELAILRKLFEEEHLSIRELALKTARSTGGLDPAIKKLMERGILAKESINGAPRYYIASLRSLVDHMRSTMQKQQQELIRKQENFEAFLATISLRKHRPSLQHFDGKDGILRLSHMLLEEHGELLNILPRMEDNWYPSVDAILLHGMHMRRIHAIPLRVLAPNVSYAHVCKSRDDVAYRTTKISQDVHNNIQYHWIIAKNTVGYIDHRTDKAFAVCFPAFCESQRSMFEALWSES